MCIAVRIKTSLLGKIRQFSPFGPLGDVLIPNRPQAMFKGIPFQATSQISRNVEYQRKVSKDCAKFLLVKRSLTTGSSLCGDATTDDPGQTGGSQLTNEQEKRLLRKRKKEEKRKQRIESQRLKAERKKTEEEDCLYTVPTAPGEKKDTSVPLPKAYNSKYTEAAWYSWWEEQGYFNPDYRKVKEPCEDPFVLCLPPPNVTGSLHLGHALGNSIEDAIVRWHRMCGRKVLWVPGSDHAGIATQVVVEKKLWREQGLTRHDLGREKFVGEVWKWKDEKGVTIYDQMRRLGSSLDWTRDVFTLDPKLSRAVSEAFIRLHDEGLIYRSKRMVNWSCALNSAISDIEVDKTEVTKRTLLQIPGYDKKVPFGELTYFAYPVKDSDEEVVVATTRPETMLGDTGVAVHPEDPRYTHIHGRSVIHPFSGRSLPVLTDSFVEKAFGTGAVKLTPGHDITDWEVGQRHDLDLLEILDDRGHLVNVPETFKGLKRFDARSKVVEALKTKGVYRGQKPNPMSIPVCSRSSDIIEPRLKDQWYVNCQEMGQKAVQAVKSGELKLVPSNYEKQWFEWLENTQDWCISRQLWWGHRVPAYRVTYRGNSDTGVGDCNETWVCAHSHSEAVDKATHRLGAVSADIEVTQDEDVLDTWFSSALFPFSIFGWPEQTKDLRQFYPTSLLETASDIMFFWVARMVMLGQKLTGSLPFKEVLFHSILRDAHGRKMSKSLGNVIDPMDVIEGISLQDLNAKLISGNLSQSEIKKAQQGQERDFPLGIPLCGADPLRFTLCSYNYKAHYVNIDVDHVKTNRNFCNKIWQAFKYTTSNLGDDFVPISLQNLKVCDMECNTDRWILSRLSHLVHSCDKNFSSYDVNIAAQGLLTFWWHEFCDTYLEYSKHALASSVPSQVSITRHLLYHCMETGLRLMAPFMPYITEELFQRLARRPGCQAESLCIDEYPQPSHYPWQNPEIDGEIDTIRSLVSPVLALRNCFRLTKARPQVYIQTDNPNTRSAVESHKLTFETLARSANVTLLSSLDPEPQGCCSASSQDEAQVFLVLKGHIDMNTEKTHITKEINKLSSQLNRLLTKPEPEEPHLQLLQAEKVRYLKHELEQKLKVEATLKQWES